MAQVAYEAGAVEAPETRVPDDYQRVQPTAAEAGGLISRGLEQLGAGASHAGQFFGEVQTDDASTGAMMRMDKAIESFRTLQGADRLRAQSGTEKEIESAYQEGRSGLGSPAQQLQYDQITRNFRLRYVNGQVSTLAAEAGRTYATGVNTNTANFHLGLIAANPDDEETFRHNVADVASARVRQTQVEGRGEAAAGQASSDAIAEGWATRVRAKAAAGDPATALQWADQHRKELSVVESRTGVTYYDMLHRELRGLADQQIGNDAAGRAISRASAGPSPIIPAEGAGTMSPGSVESIASVVNDGETPNGRTINASSISQISPDTNGSKSYGFQGLNSATGSAAQFAREYGQRFGLTAEPGSAGFDAQWRSAAADNPGEFRRAQLDFFRDHNVAPVVGDLQARGVPPEVARDARVVTYFADRRVQMGEVGLDNAASAWSQSHGDVPQFLRNMTAIDARPENLQSHFQHALASGVYSEQGNANRLQKRLDGALGAGSFKSEAYRIALDDPALQGNPVATQHALQRINQAYAAYQVASDQDARARKEAAEAAAANYVQQMILGTATPQIVQQIATDPRLASDPQMMENLYGFAQNKMGLDDTAQYGPAYTETYRRILSTGDDRIADANDILKLGQPGGGLTPRGTWELMRVFTASRKDPDQADINRAKVAMLEYAKQKLSFDQEMLFPGVPPLRDPRGQQIFDAEFVPKFLNAYDKWTRGEGGKAGKDPWQFLTRENVDKMMEGMRSRADMNRDRLAAMGSTAPEAEVAKNIPAPPSGVDQDAWRSVLITPPEGQQSVPFSTQQLGAAISVLIKNPTPEAMRVFNTESRAGKAGYKAEDILKDLGIAVGGGDRQSQSSPPAPSPMPVPSEAPRHSMFERDTTSDLPETAEARGRLAAARQRRLRESERMNF